VVGRGENRAVINLADVKKLAALHLTYRDMAEFFGCKETTFRDHFRLVVEQSRQRTKQRLMEAMLTNAIDKMNPTVQIWLSKNLLGFSDNPINTTEDTVLPWLDDTDE
jgi:AraC-like DNA-binding protein